MNFGHDIEMHLHYEVSEIEGEDNLYSEHDLVLKALSKDKKWVEVPEAIVNTVESTVSLTSRQVSAYYALCGRRPLPTAVEEEEQSQIPIKFALLPNFPNPFNVSTTIRFDLAKEAWVRLEIINALGQPIRTLVDGPHRAGYASIQWNGQDDAGRDIASGVFLYRLRTSKQMEMRKLLLLR